MNSGNLTIEIIEAWRSGVEEFNRQRYWHAHEAWEKGWLQLPSPHKEYVQGLIQACAVFIHLRNHRFDPALRLCRRSLELIQGSQARGMEGGGSTRVEIAGLVDLLRQVQTSLESQSPHPLRILDQAHALRAKLLP